MRLKNMVFKTNKIFIVNSFKILIWFVKKRTEDWTLPAWVVVRLGKAGVEQLFAVQWLDVGFLNDYAEDLSFAGVNCFGDVFPHG